MDERINSIGDETIHVEKTIRSIKGDSALFIKELEQIAPNSCFKTLYGHTNLVECLDFNDPFSTLVTGSADKSLKVWDLSSNMCIGNLIGHTGWVRSVQIDNYSVISGSGDCTMKHWDTSTLDSGICTSDMEFTGHSGGVSALQFAQGVLVSGSADTTIKQWDMRTGTNIQTLRTSRSIRDDSCDTLIYGGSTINRDLPYTTAEFQGWSETAIEPVDQVVSNTGGAVCSIYFWEHALAGGYGDGVIRLWDLRAGTYHRELTGHSASVTAVQFDSNYIFSGSTDGRFNVWDIRGGAILQTIEFTQGITDLHVDSSLVSIANGSIQISIYRRDSESISHLGGVDGHNKVVRTVKHMNGRLISGAMDNTVRIWKLG